MRKPKGVGWEVGGAEAHARMGGDGIGAGTKIMQRSRQAMEGKNGGGEDTKYPGLRQWALACVNAEGGLVWGRGLQCCHM